MKLIKAMARTFSVPPGFFFDDYDDGQAGLLQEQVELLALVGTPSLAVPTRCKRDPSRPGVAVSSGPPLR